MELLQELLPSASGLRLQGWQLDRESNEMVMTVESTQSVACCPLCNCPSGRVHSSYQRTLKDLPMGQFSLKLLLQVCKFFCLNEDCHRRIFSERLPGIVAPWARQTERCKETLQAIAVELGGSAAVRLSQQLGLGQSRNSFLRLLNKLTLPEMATPKILGVDDFAWRKGHHYGTILVDLEKRQVIALLPDREAATLANWLQANPGVEILSRDRSKAYKQGMSEGAPDAIQVADRFHLLHNLEEALEKAFKGHSSVFKRVEKEQLKAAGVDLTEGDDELSSQPTLSTQEREQAERRSQKRELRLYNYEQVHTLRKQGYQTKDIAHHLGMGERTVYTYLSHPTFPEWQPTVRGSSSAPSILEPYKPYLLEQWNQGSRQGRQLFREIQQQGYRGSYQTLLRYTRKLFPCPQSLNQLPGRGPAPAVKNAARKPLSASKVAWLILQRPETLNDEQQALLALLQEQSELAPMLKLAQGFIEIVRQRLPESLDTWIEAAEGSTISAFRSFARGLRDDYDAVRAGVTLDVSNGQVEGQNNRLKMLKRQMFGRAGLDLLAKRLIFSAP